MATVLLTGPRRTGTSYMFSGPRQDTVYMVRSASAYMGRLPNGRVRRGDVYCSYARDG